MASISVYCPKCGVRVRSIDYGEGQEREFLRWLKDKKRRDLERRFSCSKCGITFLGKESFAER